MRAADDFRGEILSLTNTFTSRYRARLVLQRELLEDGVRLARLMDRFGDKFAPVGELAEVRFGVNSGKMSFSFRGMRAGSAWTGFREFHEFRREFRVNRERVESCEIKLVRCGDGYGEIRPIEVQYLEPEVHSLMEVKGYTVRPEDCGRMILLVGEPRSRLKGTFVLKYIEWGESKGWHKGATCAARVTDMRAWYDLTGHRRGVIFWPKSQQYKHVAPVNEHDLQAN